MNTTFDLVIIGGGPGGYVAAIRGSQLNMKVALVEREHLGGICLNWGCIPTKAMLRSAEIFENIKNAKEFGLTVEGFNFNLEKIVERSRKISFQLNSGVEKLLQKHKVSVFKGEAILSGINKVKVGKITLETKKIILSTGARSRNLPGVQVDGNLIWNYRNALVAKTLPKKLLIVGSGAIGVEFASFFNSLGSDVTIVEMEDRIVPVEDEEISLLAEKSFKKDGINILTSTTVKKISSNKKDVSVTLEKEGKLIEMLVDRVLLAIGVIGNSEISGLEATNVKIENSFIKTNEWCHTDEEGIYAIGDVAGAPWLAHKASHEGVICVEKIAGEKNVLPLDKNLIPGCTYCRPQIASVGLTEQKAKDAGYAIRVGRFPFAGNGKALAIGASEGLVKTIFDTKTGELLGAHLIGAGVTELIQGYSVAKTLETTEVDLTRTVFPHPTLSEMLHESVLNAFEKTIHF